MKTRSARPRISVYIAMSLDGYIAREDGNLDWLDAAGESVPDDDDCGYAQFMSTVDVLVMGRKTFEKVLSFEGDWPFAEQRVVVLSRGGTQIPSHLSKTVTQTSEEPEALCQRLAEEGHQHVYLDGGRAIQSFLSVGLVDDMTVTVIPLLIGKGIPLFGETPDDIQLECTAAKHYDFGFVQLQYTVKHVCGKQA